MEPLDIVAAKGISPARYDDIESAIREIKKALEMVKIAIERSN